MSKTLPSEAVNSFKPKKISKDADKPAEFFKKIIKSSILPLYAFMLNQKE